MSQLSPVWVNLRYFIYMTDNVCTCVCVFECWSVSNVRVLIVYGGTIQDQRDSHLFGIWVLNERHTQSCVWYMWCVLCLVFGECGVHVVCMVCVLCMWGWGVKVGRGVDMVCDMFQLCDSVWCVVCVTCGVWCVCCVWHSWCAMCILCVMSVLCVVCVRCGMCGAYAVRRMMIYAVCIWCM